MGAFSYEGVAVGPLVRMTRGLEHGRIRWWLAEHSRFVARTRSGDLAFDLDAGDSTDGCSSPWFLQWLVPAVTFDTFLPAGLHDKLWTQRQAERAAGNAPTYRRELIDWIFREALRGEGVGFTRRWSLWAAVRLQAWWTGDRDGARVFAPLAVLCVIVGATLLLAGCALRLGPTLALELHAMGTLSYRAGATRPKMIGGLRASVVTRAR